MDFKETVIKELLKGFPDIFRNSEIIGVYDGDFYCKYFISNANYLENLTFYENFHSMKSPEKFIRLYQEWESNTPNLNIKLEDGSNFSKNSTYLHIDVSNTDLYNFVKSNWKKIKNKKCISFYAFDNSPCNTLLVSKLILEDYFFPFLQHGGVMYGTTNFKSHEDSFTRVANIFKQKNIEFAQQYIHAYTNEYPMIHTNNGWKNRLKDHE